VEAALGLLCDILGGVASQRGQEVQARGAQGGPGQGGGQRGGERDHLLGLGLGEHHEEARRPPGLLARDARAGRDLLGLQVRIAEEREQLIWFEVAHARAM
jgi:hypothetical protein